MAQEIEKFPQVPEDPASLPYEGYVAAWRYVENRSRWLKARLAAAVATAYGEKTLKKLAADVGVAYPTMAMYRKVGTEYPAQYSDRSEFSVSVANVLVSQPDRLELAGREEPWTVQEARELVAVRNGTKQKAHQKPEADGHESGNLTSHQPETTAGQGKDEPVDSKTGPAADVGSVDGAPSGVTVQAVSSEGQASVAEGEPPASTSSVQPPETEGQTLTIAGQQQDPGPEPVPCARCAELEAALAEKDHRIERLEQDYLALEKQKEELEEANRFLRQQGNGRQAAMDEWAEFRDRFST
jgi:hypothetical protein